jgi:hypothetical protein
MQIACPGQEESMETSERTRKREEGRAGWIVLWLLGIPIPILLILYVLRGCT